PRDSANQATSRGTAQRQSHGASPTPVLGRHETHSTVDTGLIFHVVESPKCVNILRVNVTYLKRVRRKEGFTCVGLGWRRPRVCWPWRVCWSWPFPGRRRPR